MKLFQLAVFGAGFALILSAAFAATTESVHPVVDAQSGYLLGGSKNGKWVNANEAAKTLKGGETYRVYGNTAAARNTTGSKPRTDEAPCDETYWVTPKKNFNGVVALGATWNAIPRKARSQKLNQRTY